MVSIRRYFSCLGIQGNLSVLHGLFGLGRAPEQLSLLEHLARLRRPFLVHLNVIRVGLDTQVTPARDILERKIDMAVHRTRQIYDQIGLGIARVEHHEIPHAFAGGFRDIGGDGEADDLCCAHSVDNDGIDMFMPLTYAGNRIGSSRSPGSCGKGGKSSGVVCEVDQAGAELTATAFAHELGHYLGWGGHSSDPTNLMSVAGGRGLTGGQRVRMLAHCMVTDCPDLRED